MSSYRRIFEDGGSPEPGNHAAAEHALDEMEEIESAARGLVGYVARVLEIIDEGHCRAVPIHLSDALRAWSARLDAALDTDSRAGRA